MNKYYISFDNHEGYFTPNDIDEVLSLALNEHMIYGDNKGKYCYNVPCAFDIETSSFYVDDEGVVNYSTVKQIKQHDKNYNPKKVAIMYVWQFGINGYVIIGRTWIEFIDMISRISERLQLNPKKKTLVVYVHNLAFEFQFMRKWFDWFKVFSVDNRKPVYAINTKGIEFRCSLLLSGYSLANLSNQIRYFPVKKMVGDLDYSLIRHSKTPLSDTELGYCINDVQVVMSYIYDCIQDEGTITQIPMTKTGYVRRYCKQNCLKIPNTRKRDKKYSEIVSALRIETIEEFDLIQHAFMGGFTHANARYSGLTMHNVDSYDFTSSYPYVLVSEKFPMSSSVEVAPKTLDEAMAYMNKYCCVFEVAFVGIRCIKVQENYISISKCTKYLNPVIDNGRVAYADMIATVITDVDFTIIKNFYTWKEIRFKKFYIYHKAYLPTPLVKCILKLYSDKTTLKGVQGKEVEYMQGKAMLNSVYGMCVTNPLRDEYIISEDGELWDVIQALGVKRQELLDYHNDSNTRFLYYLWGVYCTAYARRNLFTAIAYIGDDYLYSDTDSVKIRNGEKYKTYFDGYNRQVEAKLTKAAAHHSLDVSAFAPKTIKGESKMLGVWDYEGQYKTFKTLGAKRYAIESYDSDGNPNALKVNGVWYPVSITVSGVNKFTAIPYLFDELANKSVGVFMANFSEGLKVPDEHTGKLLHTYIDDVRSGIVVDYRGEAAEYLELSAVHLEPTGYDLSIAAQYTEYLLGVREGSF